jgi:hypothetical protein
MVRERSPSVKPPQNYLPLNNEAGYTVSQQNNLMLPTRFAPIKR